MIDEKELKEIEKRCKYSTRGPWKAYIEGRDHSSGSHFIMTGDENDRGEDFEIEGARVDDYIFIANAKQDIPKLIDEIRRLKNLVGNDGNGGSVLK
ncbi:hypothetical protein [Winogradskyella luteola]|uniref:Uncharacterized protein n=1 Tax=Winogradskyella luteola TaxID=2828330 RepID=A0A9X1JTL5_9FLAO|nr:hypothetical protein [Winogradskyella luteola]MBV7270742.1 hypothetical protein [Winogradskyella luteola]